ncbi:MAG TPA: cation diffusion facilitator family transporter [Polyangiaceae bacterium]
MAAADPHAHDEGQGRHHDHHRGAHGEPRAPQPVAHGEFTPGEAKQARRLKMVVGLVSAFFVLELLGALWADSVVLQADALHLLMDVLALAVSLFAMRLAVRRPTPRFTYGLRRAEPVAAIFSALLVLATTAGIVFEGVDALHHHASPRAGIMLAVAIMALFVNGLSAWLLHDAIGHGHAHDPDNPDDHDEEHDHEGHDHDQVHDHAHDGDHGPHAAKAHGHALNLRGAWLHLMGDALGAIAAIGAALVIRFGGPVAADPIASFAVAAILFFGSLRLLRDATLVLLESAPAHLPPATIRAFILGSPGVIALHDLHVWTLGAGHDALTVHVRTDEADPAFGQKLSERIRSRMGLEYVTVQVECEGEACGAPRSTWETGDKG